MQPMDSEHSGALAAAPRGGSTMFRAVLCGILLFATCNPVLADDGNAAASALEPWIAHVAITVLGSLVAIHFALEAFARPVEIDNAPTFPRYMTSRQQYRLGSWLFVLFACGFFLLLVYEHVVEAASVFEQELPGLIKEALKAPRTRARPTWSSSSSWASCISIC
jgi:hypothetical protein